MNLSALLLDQHLAARGEGPAVRAPGLERGFGELARRVGASVAALAEAGVGRGDTAAITSGDRPK